MSIYKSQQQFEEWFSECRSAAGKGSAEKALAWESWQASRASVSINLPSGGYFAGYDNEHMMESRDVRDAIEEAGLKVKK